MSASRPNSRSTTIFYGIAGGVVFVVALGAYFGFVVREARAGEEAAAVADRLTKQVERAQEYIEAHKNISDMKKKIEEMTIKVQLAVARGPVDVTVGSYLDKRAAEAGIEDLKWNFREGIKPPSSDHNDDDRLSLDPAMLKSSPIDLQFSGRYKDVLKLIRSLSPEEGMAPWPVQINQLELRRPLGGATGYKSSHVIVNMSLRYFHQ